MSCVTKTAPVCPPVVLDPTAWVCCDLWFPEPPGRGGPLAQERGGAESKGCLLVRALLRSSAAS